MKIGRRIAAAIGKFFLPFTVMVMVLTFLAVVGCDEAMNMTKPIIMEPSEDPMSPEDPIEDPMTMGDMKKPDEEKPAEDQKPEEPETPDPDDDQKPEELETPDPNDEQKPEPPGHGIVPTTEAEEIMLDIITDVFGYDDSTATTKERRVFKLQHDAVVRDYGHLFDVETEVGRETFKRFAEYEQKKGILYSQPPPPGGRGELLEQWFEEAYDISRDYALWLVHEVYLKEKPEDKKYLSILWQVFDISMEYLLLRIANPEATEEELLELLRESIRAGNITIAA